MRLGSFYGFTVPMLVAAANNDLHKIVSDFNVKLNNIAAEDIQKELWHFYHNLSTIKPDLELLESNIDEYTQKATITNGAIVGSITDEERCEILNCMVDICGKRLYEQLVNGRMQLDVTSLEDEATFRQQMIKLVNVALTGATFPLSNLGSLQRNFSKQLKAESMRGDIEKVKNNIKVYCMLEEKLPFEIMIDGNFLKLTDDEHKVLSYYHSNLPVIKEFMQELPLANQNEQTVFGIPFIDFLNRKPTCLYYMIVKRFDYLKNSDIRLLQNVLDKVKQEFICSKQLIESRLFSDNVVYNLIDVDNVGNYFEDEPVEFINFIEDIYSDMDTQAINQSDLLKLRNLYYAAKYLSLDKLNELWGTDFNDAGFKQLTDKFNLLHLGGLNLSTFELYRASLREIIFTSGERINKNDEYKNELQQICKDIEAFLSTFKQIGGELIV